MPRLDPPMKWSWVEPSSCRGTHPQPPRAKPFTGCAACSFLCTGGTATACCGWVGHSRGALVARDMFRPERRLPSRAGTPRPWQAAPRPWQAAAVGRFGSNAPPRRRWFAWDTLVAVWLVARSHRREGRPWWAVWQQCRALLGKA